MEKNQIKTMEKAAIDSLSVEKSASILHELGEIVLDEDASQEILDELPILRYRKIFKSIKDAFFFNKFCKFLGGCSRTPIEHRKNYISGLSHEDIISNGKYLITYIDRLDDESKPGFAGRIFSAYVLGEITKNEMLRFNHILEKIFILDLLELKYAAEEDFLEADLAIRLAPLGITEYIIQDDPRLHQALYELSDNRSGRPTHGFSLQPLQSEIIARVTKTGNDFVQVIFDVNRE